MSTVDTPESYKVVVLGYYSVGKSSLVMKYVKGTFNPNEESTIGAAFMTKTTENKGQPVKYEIWDTAGQERYNSLIPMYYRGAHVALIVYDITKPDSFECAKKWVEELKIEKPSDFVKVLIGNKCDLQNRKVSVDEALSFASENGLMFFEASAKTGHNIERIFSEIANVLPKKKKAPKIASISVSGNKKNMGCC